MLVYDKDSAMRTCKNRFQGDYKKVLCICSAGLLRSPTAALVLSQDPYYYNTRSAGIEHYALIPVSDVLLEWADEIVCMTDDQQQRLRELTKKPVLCLMIPDDFSYRDHELVAMIHANYNKATQSP